MESANITPVFKKNDRTAKTNYRPISMLLNLSLKSLKGAFINNYQHMLMGYFQSNNVGLERVSMHDRVY